jgi:high-affinity Fe2+/Pb2+ permease
MDVLCKTQMFACYVDRMTRWFRDKFGAGLARDMAVTFVVVFVTVELVVTAYYGLFEPQQLVSQSIASGIVALIAGLTATWMLARTNRRHDALSYRLRRLNDLDQMTGLLNRQAFLRDVQQLLDQTPG